MLYPTLRKLGSALRQTPLHPQWAVFLRENRNLKRLSHDCNGHILDIGCAGQKPRSYLPAHSEYIGLDYYSTVIRCGIPLGLLAMFLPLLIPACNLMTWVLARIAPRVDFMPFGYCLILTKPA